MIQKNIIWETRSLNHGFSKEREYISRFSNSSIFRDYMSLSLFLKEHKEKAGLMTGQRDDGNLSASTSFEVTERRKSAPSSQMTRKRPAIARGGRENGCDLCTDQSPARNSSELK